MLHQIRKMIGNAISHAIYSNSILMFYAGLAIAIIRNIADEEALVHSFEDKKVIKYYLL